VKSGALKSTVDLARDGVPSCLISAFHVFLLMVFVDSGSLVMMSDFRLVSSVARLCRKAHLIVASVGV
jgi:hypothetical protein